MAKQNVRVRIPPSPTGNLHVGTARAALFNELFARKTGGTFIVRIEDTDKKRSKKEFEDNILEGFRWLGLQWQEGPDVGGPYGPYRQSERRRHYTAALNALIAKDLAYIDEAANNVVRLRVHPQVVTFQDLIRGEVKVHSDTWGGNFVIARALNDPLYHLAVVVDDAAQQITHVIRGEDHLTNTARHILLQQALGLPTPQYAHLPLLLNEQRRKLSKRAGDVSLLVYRDRGYIPAAMLNYLALLGWNPKNDREFFTHEELVLEFKLAGVQKAGAVFSLTKLNAVNKHYLRQLAPAELLKYAQPFLEQTEISVDDAAYWQAALVTEQERVSTLRELAEAVDFFRADWQPEYKPGLLVWRKSTSEQTQDLVVKLQTFLCELPEDAFTVKTLTELLLKWIDEQKLGRGDALWPLRVALTGLKHSPGPFEIASVLGKTETLRRVEAAIVKSKAA